MMHGHTRRVKSGPMAAIYAARECGADILLFGHTHQPVVDRSGDFWVMNPGCIGPSVRRTYGVITLEDGRWTAPPSACERRRRTWDCGFRRRAFSCWGLWGCCCTPPLLETGHIRPGMFCFYTNLSNLLVLVWELALAAAPEGAVRRLLTGSGVALAMTLCIYVTHLIYHFVLVPDARRRGKKFADFGGSFRTCASTTGRRGWWWGSGFCGGTRRG